MTDTPTEETKPAPRLAPGDARIVCWLVPHEGEFVVSARVAVRGRRTLDVKLGDEGTLFFLAALRAAHPDALPETGVPDVPSIEALRAQVAELERELTLAREDLEDVGTRAADRVRRLEAELEQYRREAVRPNAPLLGFGKLEPLTTIEDAPPLTPPEAPRAKRGASEPLPPDVEAELEDIAKRLDGNQMVALSDLELYVEKMRFRKLEGVHVDAFTRAAELVNEAKAQPFPGAERPTGR